MAAPTLDELIEFARTYQPTATEKREYAISFAYGNVALHNPEITRADVERVFDELQAEREKANGQQ